MKFGKTRRSGCQSGLAIVGYLSCVVLALAQSPGDCVVNILNRTSVVGTDGRWRVENVPSFDDLYDVDYSTPWPATTAALVQSGFGTIGGQRGNVRINVVRVDGNITGVTLN